LLGEGRKGNERRESRVLSFCSISKLQSTEIKGAVRREKHCLNKTIMRFFGGRRAGRQGEKAAKANQYSQIGVNPSEEGRNKKIS